MADLIDQHTDGEGRPTNSTTHAHLEPVDVDNVDNTETTVNIPPLQAKLELLKKSEGVPSAYDDEECDDLAVIKNNAGINTMAKHEMADDDGPFEG
jgi:hypothetical protein